MQRQSRTHSGGARHAVLLVICASLQSLACITTEVDMSCRSQPLDPAEVRFLSREELIAPLDIGRLSNAERAILMRDALRSAGCDAAFHGVTGSRDPNVICTLPGATRDVILVGAHYDRSLLGQGIADNWSGARLLPALYTSLAAQPRRHTYMFVAFADEEAGLVGSRYLAATSRDMPLRAMVNLDTLGLSPTKVEIRSSNDMLVCNLIRAAIVQGVGLSAVDVDRAGTSDFVPFAERGVPVVSIHSLTRETLPIIHTSDDTMDALDLDAYVETYRLVALYLAMLDQALERQAAPLSETADRDAGGAASPTP